VADERRAAQVQRVAEFHEVVRVAAQVEVAMLRERVVRGADGARVVEQHDPVLGRERGDDLAPRGLRGAEAVDEHQGRRRIRATAYAGIQSVADRCARHRGSSSPGR
jgi:hypothetical protein